MAIISLKIVVFDKNVRVIIDIVDKNTLKKGKKCSVQGRKYEKEIADLCKSLKSYHIDNALNTQTDDELGGCSAHQDILLNFYTEKDTGIEVKRVTPDWMQLSIVPDTNGAWKSSSRSKIPLESRYIFEKLITDITLFHPPPFLERAITYEEWKASKHLYKDCYKDVPNDTIARVYSAKGSHYIQLNGYGLYHTGTDPCNFNVPFFTCEQRLRVRCKRHGKKDANGNHLPSSVMASLCPKLRTLLKSPYSLDDMKKIPNGIISLIK